MYPSYYFLPISNLIQLSPKHKRNFHLLTGRQKSAIHHRQLYSVRYGDQTVRGSAHVPLLPRLIPIVPRSRPGPVLPPAAALRLAFHSRRHFPIGGNFEKSPSRIERD